MSLFLDFGIQSIYYRRHQRIFPVLFKYAGILLEVRHERSHLRFLILASSDLHLGVSEAVEAPHIVSQKLWAVRLTVEPMVVKEGWVGWGGWGCSSLLSHRHSLLRR